MTSTVDTVEIPVQKDDNTASQTIPEQSPDDSTPDSTVDSPVMGQAEREAEYNRVIHVDPNEIVIDVNVRVENAKTDPDTIRHMKTFGVSESAKGYRNADGVIVVTTGQRRVLNARKAGCEVPVWIQRPPSEDEREAAIDRIVDQVNENELRLALTRGDVYRAVKQLQAFDLTPTDIGKRLGRRTERIKKVVKVGDSELAAKAADKYDLDLEQAAIIAEFDEEGDIAGVKKLIQTAVETPNNFKGLVAQLRRERVEAEHKRKITAVLVAELTEAGVTIADESVKNWDGAARSLDRLRPSPDSEQYTDLTAEEHSSCPGRIAWIVEDTDEQGNVIMVPEYGCGDFRAHGHALSNAPEGRVDHSSSSATTAQADPNAAADDSSSTVPALPPGVVEVLEKEKARFVRNWTRDHRKAWDEALPDRRKFLAEFAQRKKLPEGAQAWLAVQKLKGHHEVRKSMEKGHALAHELLKLPKPTKDKPSELFDRIAKATMPVATILDVFLTLCAMEENLPRDAWDTPRGSDKDLMSALITWEHKASDVELLVLNPRKVRDALAARYGEDRVPSDQTDSDDDSTEGGEDTKPEAPESQTEGDSPVIDGTEHPDTEATGEATAA